MLWQLIYARTLETDEKTYRGDILEKVSKTSFAFYVYYDNFVPTIYSLHESLSCI